MDSSEVFRQIRRIEIITSRLVNDVFAGEYHSVFKGRGIEFSEVREYLPGDDVRAIDWNVTARMRRPYVKRYAEERELTIVLAVDVSGSQYFGSQERLKSELVAEVCALLAFSAIKNNDKVALLLFSDQVEKFVPPQKGRKHVLRVIREALRYRPRGRGTSLHQALEYLGQVLRRRAVIFIISDFRDRGFERPLRIAGKRHDCIPVTITDPREEDFEAVGLIELVGAEDGHRALIDTSAAGVREGVRAAAEAERQFRREVFRGAGIEPINLKCGEPYVPEFVRFFDERAKRMGR